MRAARVFLFTLVLLTFGCFRSLLAQEMKDRIEKVPAKVTDMYGKTIEREITVTVFEIPGRAPYPLLVLNHGRAVNDADRAKLGRARYTEISRWFASLGYSVWVPTRIGYGVSGTGSSDDPEYSGSCSAKQYAPGFAAAADQTLQVIEYAKTKSDINARRIVVVGQSYGGMTSIAVAARNTPGVVATINFAGGSGGNPETRPGMPCGADLLRDLSARYGKAAQVPTLWVYTENDRWMGARFPREWFDAFRAAGGKGEFVMHPPHGEDGHSLFTRGAWVWQPGVQRFLEGIKEGAPQ